MAKLVQNLTERAAVVKIIGTLLYLFGALGGAAALGLCLMLWVEKPIGLPCHATNYDGILRIENWPGTSEYLVTGGHDVFLASTRLHAAGPVGMAILKGLPSGSHLHVEFCGSQFVRLTSEGHEIFMLTQQGVEENVAHGIASTVRFTVFCFIAAILGYLVARRASDI
ncbi:MULTISPECIES: hypothetical protein [Paraburkholderia]|uniref:hypothetical protein n=1 Tax=Paraburkholderia TaxID=1822464 RepID=UPI002AB17E59|nr:MULTISPECIES: hypothetical protein [Paraburkholderia]